MYKNYLVKSVFFYSYMQYYETLKGSGEQLKMYQKTFKFPKYFVHILSDNNY